MLQKFTSFLQKLFWPERLLPQLLITQKDLSDLLPNHEHIPINLINYQYIYGNMPLSELSVLVKIIQHFKPKKIFEIGTYIGNTTLQMAANSNALIYTLDLPPKNRNQSDLFKIFDPTLDVYPDTPGVKLKDSRYSYRVKQLYGDSYKFNFRSFYGKMDLVFVDGSHHFRYVYKDSQNAIKLLSSKGIVIWHDYAPYAKEVIKALNALRKQLPLFHITNTSLVYFNKQKS